MAKNQNTFEKMRREMEKKRKASEKRERKIRRKEEGAAVATETPPADDVEAADDAPEGVEPSA